MTKQIRRNIQQICLIPPTSISFVVTLVNYNRKRRKVFHFKFPFRTNDNEILRKRSQELHRVQRPLRRHPKTEMSAQVRLNSLYRYIRMSFIETMVEI